MKITVLIVAILLTVLFVLYRLTGYKSAFEADQQCHSEMSLNYPDNSGLGCDHDLETRQWILFSKSENNQPAIVLKRYRY